MNTIASILDGLASVGLALVLVQLAAACARRREPAATGRRTDISILKPLCGLDDELAENLASFAALEGARYEVLLGVRDVDDAAYPVALGACARRPDVFRLVVQEGSPGENPKVNQLVTLAAAARYDLLLVSDSNVRVDPGYLREVAAAFADPTVALATSPIVGSDGPGLGARMDALPLTGSVGPGVIAAKRLARQDVTIGKSMAIRVRDLEAIGGFEAVADVLAEDQVIGRLVRRRPERRVVLLGTPVVNVSRTRTARSFFERYRRWSVIHRQIVPLPLYAGELLLQPTALALLAAILAPGAATLGAFVAALLLRAAFDQLAALRLRGEGLSWLTIALGPVKEALLALAWCQGLVSDVVVWRGKRLRVLPGTRLAAAPGRSRTPQEARR